MEIISKIEDMFHATSYEGMDSISEYLGEILKLIGQVNEGTYNERGRGDVNNICIVVKDIVVWLQFILDTDDVYYICLQLLIGNILLVHGFMRPKDPKIIDRYYQLTDELRDAILEQIAVEPFSNMFIRIDGFDAISKPEKIIKSCIKSARKV